MKFHLYRDEKKEWRWRLVARNGRIIADSGEGSKRKAAAIACTERVREASTVATIVIDELNEPGKYTP